MSTNSKCKTVGFAQILVCFFILCFSGFHPIVLAMSNNASIPIEQKSIKVGYLRITPNLPFYVALEEGLFLKNGLNVEAVPFKTSNEIIEALIAKRIDFTTVAALSVIQSLEVASPGRIKIYQVNYIPKNDPNDYLIVKKGRGINSIGDLKGKKIGLFPGSNFNIWAKLIFQNHFAFENQLVTVSLPPQLHVQSLSAQTVDAIYCLEPTATIAIEKGIGEVLDVGLVCKYIFDPFPVTANAVLSTFASENKNTTELFCETMYKSMEMIELNPDTYRHYLSKYCNVPENIAAKVKLGHGKASSDIEIQPLQKTVDIYFEAGLLKKKISMRSLLLYPPK
ncbi:MAG: ABC transporter substrate-binding protein [Desulfobacteraceae bacterium]|nr:ABC transporter substrate-binding protein [Desulfobacteraceae bacterium]